MELETTVPVAASPAEVWEVLADVERWPTIIAIYQKLERIDNGPLQVGSEAWIKESGFPRMRWKVTTLEPGRSFVWESRVGGVTNVAGHEVVADGDGSKLTISLKERGPMAGVVGLLYGGRLKKVVSQEAEGIRRAAESAAH